MIDSLLTFLRKNPNLFVIILVGANLFVAGWGFISLYSSPYTGINLNICGVRPCINSVDRGSPADLAGVLPEDRIVDVNGIGIPDFAFYIDPFLLGSKKDLPLYWEAQRMLDEAVTVERPLKILIERGRRLEISLTPVHYPLSIAAGTMGLFLPDWIFIFLTYLILRKKRNEATLLFFIAYAVTPAINQLNIFQLRDLSFPYIPFRLFEFLSYFSILIYPIYLHLPLVFPRRGKLLDRYPWLVAGLYSFFGLLLILRLTGILDLYGRLAYLPGIIVSLLFPLLLLYRFFREEDPAY